MGAAIASLPSVHHIPARPVVGPVRRWAAKNLAAWYSSILAKIASGKIRPRINHRAALAGV
jgi:hypothetical protein